MYPQYMFSMCVHRIGLIGCIETDELIDEINSKHSRHCNNTAATSSPSLALSLPFSEHNSQFSICEYSKF